MFAALPWNLKGFPGFRIPFGAFSRNEIFGQRVNSWNWVGINAFDELHEKNQGINTVAPSVAPLSIALCA